MDFGLRAGDYENEYGHSDDAVINLIAKILHPLTFHLINPHV